MKIVCADGLDKLMLERGIKTEDIEKMISWIECGRAHLFSTDEGIYIARAKIGFSTYYMEYVKDDGAYRVLDVYCHSINLASDMQ